MIERTFQDIPDDKIGEADQQSFLVSIGWARGSTWDDLLRSKRVLLISEAGAGKTYECRAQKKRLFDVNQPAFFVELAAMATDELRNLMVHEEEERFDAWLASQSEVATFFLDSIDELKISRGSFERALKRFKKGIGNRLHRAIIVVTTRPIPFDQQLIREILPVPQPPSTESVEEAFAKIAMHEHQKQRNDETENQLLEWRSVALMPLSDEQVIKFAHNQGVSDPDQLLKDLQRRNAQEFARRPQDLIEMCADWREYKRIRTHRDQVKSNIRVKLLPSGDREEPAELSVDKAIEGAGRIALALQVTRRFTIRHNAASDVGGEDAALDPATILSDWLPNERKALLERPLFGFASYGRVRFHHRSVAEYLAAERLVTLRDQGMSFRALKRILFAETSGKTIVRPSKRPVACWLAQKENWIFELLRDNEPAILLNEGDPESLTPPQRKQALRAYANRFGPGGWRGIQVPRIQIHRFASKELADEIKSIWRNGVENPDVREVLIRLVESGRIESCADIGFDVTQDIQAHAVERITAIRALVALDDKRLENIAASAAEAADLWPDRVARGAVLHLFPKYMSVEQLCRILRRLKREELNVGDINLQLPRRIAASRFNSSVLEELRDGLFGVISEGLKWKKELSGIVSNWPYLSGALAATCERSLEICRDDQWFRVCAIALGLQYLNQGGDEAHKSLRERLCNLNAADNRNLFWAADALFQSLHEVKDPWSRLQTIIDRRNETVQLRSDRDLTWVCESLGDTTRDDEERAMLLEAALRLPPEPERWREHVEGIRPLIVDEPSLVQRLNDWLKPSEYEEEDPRWKKAEAELKKQEEQREADIRASWVQFRQEVSDQPEGAFSPEQRLNTASNLCHVMRNFGGDNRSLVWNRRFIEEHINPETADRLRCVLMKVWRDNRPTFARERLESECNVLLENWLLGLGGIYAEAEEPDWAVQLSDAEAGLAVRYATIELNSLPQWVESLVDVHPRVVSQTLGNELSWELNQPAGDYGISRLLQEISYAPTKLTRLLLPRLESWLNFYWDQINDAKNETDRLRRVTRVILKYGTDAERERLRGRALQGLKRNLPFALRLVWLSSLMQIDPQAGVKNLEDQIEIVEPSERSNAVTWLASLFGGMENAIDLGGKHFTPQLLLRLVRLAYRHVRIQDDAHHDDCYSPDTRDDAESARGSIFAALINAKGRDALAANREMAADPLFVDFKDRILYLAEENWAQEVDADVYDEIQAARLDRSGEAPASTNEAMYAILKDRLYDLDDLLRADTSPREAWAGISSERVMRREIARELRHAENSIYKVVQEAVTAEEKETDIRLCSAVPPCEAVIELKLGEKYTAKQLRDTIENQLVKKYMAAPHRRAGALVVTLAKDRKWKHPDEDRWIDVDELILLLRNVAERIERESGGTLAIAVHFLDLRPRLPLENAKKPRAQKSPCQ